MGRVFEPSRPGPADRAHRGRAALRSWTGWSCPASSRSCRPLVRCGCEFTDPLLADALRAGEHLRATFAAGIPRCSAPAAPAATTPPSSCSTRSAPPTRTRSWALSLRAAAFARERGDPARALAHAERALDLERTPPPRAASYSKPCWSAGSRSRAWASGSEVAPVLGEVIRRQRRAGNEGAAVRAATEWARVRWYAGDRAEAFELIEANVSGQRPPPRRARAGADPGGDVRRPRRPPHRGARMGDPRARRGHGVSRTILTAIRALNAMGLATVRSTASPEGLSLLPRGARGGARQRPAAPGRR